MNYQAPYKIIPANDAVIQLYDGFLSLREAHQLFTEILKSTPWRQDRMTIYGREIDIPRLQAW